MALPLGKLTILVGAGIVGSVLAKEGRIPSVSDFFSGAFKIVWKQIRHDDSIPSSPKPQNDSLLAQYFTKAGASEMENFLSSPSDFFVGSRQAAAVGFDMWILDPKVNSLRQELQLLASNRPITIVTSSGSGSSRYRIIIVVIVVGYGYVWWKGWRLPDMMFATKRSLSDACNTIAKQLENVYSSIAATKRHLSSRIDRVDCNLDECAELTAATREEVSELRGEMKVIGVDVQSVHHAVRTLETKIHRIEGKQDLTNEGVRRLVDYASSLENSGTIELIQAAPPSSSRPALEMPQMTPSSRTVSLPPIPSVEPPSPSASNGSHKRTLQNAVSASGLKDLRGISEEVEALSSPRVSSGVHITEDTNNGNSGSGLFGRKLCGIGSSFFTRTRSAVQSFK